MRNPYNRGLIMINHYKVTMNNEYVRDIFP